MESQAPHLGILAPIGGLANAGEFYQWAIDSQGNYYQSQTFCVDGDIAQAYTTNLSNLRLMQAYLPYAMQGYQFIGTSLTDADLIGDDVSNDNLSGAWFTSAMLQNANLTGANAYRPTLLPRT